MKKITKRIMALMLSLVMMLGCIPSFINEANAADKPTELRFTYTDFDFFTNTLSTINETDDVYAGSINYLYLYKEDELKYVAVYEEDGYVWFDMVEDDVCDKPTDSFDCAIEQIYFYNDKDIEVIDNIWSNLAGVYANDEELTTIDQENLIDDEYNGELTEVPLGYCIHPDKTECIVQIPFFSEPTVIDTVDVTLDFTAETPNVTLNGNYEEFDILNCNYYVYAYKNAESFDVSDYLYVGYNMPGDIEGWFDSSSYQSATFDDVKANTDFLLWMIKVTPCNGYVFPEYEYDGMTVKVNGVELTKASDGNIINIYSPNESYLEIDYKQDLSAGAPKTSGVKKYKATDTKDTAEKITGSGKKGSTRTIIPQEGRKVANVVVTDKNGNKIDIKKNADGTYSFVQPASNVDVLVSYKNREIVLNIGSTEASVDGEKSNLDVCPVIRNDRTMLPIRFVAENLGAKVEWNEKNPNYVVITRGDTKIEITLGNDIMKVNGKDVKLDSVAFAENDRTYLPVRAVSEALNALVEWNESEPSIVRIFERQ